MDQRFEVLDARFPTTHWSAVYRAGDGVPDARQRALEQLLRRYLPALKAYLVKSKRLSAEEAEDLLQDFVLEKVVQGQLIAHADERRGRFRTFLLSVLDNYLVSQLRKRHAKRRSPEGGLQPLPEGAGIPGGGHDPATAYTLAWARQVLTEAMRRMEQTCREDGRLDLWEVFAARVIEPLLHHAEPLPYDQLVKRFGLASPLQAANLLVTAKRLFTRALRSVVAEYARDQEEVDEEIRELRAILAARA